MVRDRQRSRRLVGIAVVPTECYNDHDPDHDRDFDHDPDLDHDRDFDR